MVRIEHTIGSLTVDQVEDGELIVEIAQLLSPAADVLYVRHTRAGLVESSRVYEVPGEDPSGYGAIPRHAPWSNGLLFWDWIVGLVDLELARRVAGRALRRLWRYADEGSSLVPPGRRSGHAADATGGVKQPLVYLRRSLTVGDLAPPPQFVLTTSEAGT